MNSRIDAIAKNMKSALISQVLLVVSSLLVRRVFITAMGEVYLGLNGLFSDILSMLSLAELGVGASIVYHLYEPLAHGDTKKIQSLMKLYRNSYRTIGGIILAVGFLLTPHLDFFVKEMPENIPHIEWIYLLNVLNAGGSYFFIYKASLLFADQKKYVEMVITTVVKLVSYGIEVLLLLKTGNYFLYLFTMIGATFLQNILISVRVDQLYPYLKEKDVTPLSAEDKNEIRKNVAAMFFHKAGAVIVFSTDNILMAKLVSVAAVGLYSNYMMIRRVLETVIHMIYTSLTASMGNINVCETSDKKTETFHNMYFFSAWLFGLMGICLFCLYNPFISVWLGKRYLLPFHTVFVIVVNFYFFGMRVPVGRTKEAMGLFRNDWYKPIVESILNLVVSYALAVKIGLDGILWGTFISTFFVPFWIEPFVLYRYGLHCPCRSYFIRYGVYGLITVLAGWLTYGLCGFLPDTWIGFLLKMSVCTCIPNVVYAAVYHRTVEFQYLKSVGFRLLKKTVRGGK